MERCSTPHSASSSFSGEGDLLPGLSGAHLRHLDIREYQLDDLLDIPAVEAGRRAEIVQHLATAIEQVLSREETQT